MIVIVSKDKDFYNFLSDELKNLSINPISIIISYMDIRSKIESNKRNYFIFDTDCFPEYENTVKALLYIDNLYIILTGKKIRETLIFNKNVKFLLKPIFNKEFFNNKYVNDLTNVLQAFDVKQNKFFNLNSIQYKRVIAIASSTGGTEAVERIFKELPPNCPPVLLVQHMPTGFTEIFAKRLNSLCSIDVKEASDKDFLKRGLALIAPADYHMIVEKKLSNIVVRCFKGEKINGLMPAADILFDSVASIFGKKAVGVILTGMGGDGGEGLLKMKNQGALTIGQNKETSVVYGMAQTAKKLNAIDVELPLDEICARMLKLAEF